jgi:hypothetical protein
MAASDPPRPGSSPQRAGSPPTGLPPLDSKWNVRVVYAWTGRMGGADSNRASRNPRLGADQRRASAAQDPSVEAVGRGAGAATPDQEPVRLRKNRHSVSAPRRQHAPGVNGRRLAAVAAPLALSPVFLSLPSDTATRRRHTLGRLLTASGACGTVRAVAHCDAPGLTRMGRCDDLP